MATDYPTPDRAELLQMFRTLPAQFTTAEVELIDEVRNVRINRQYTRGGLAVLTRTGAELIDALADDREAAKVMATLSYGVHAQEALFRGLAEMMDDARGRILLALSARPDGMKILAKAAAKYDGPQCLPAYIRKEPRK